MERDGAARIVAASMTVSDKIRALDVIGYPRADIARLLEKRYQHVRNVLEGDKLRATSEPTPPPGMAQTSRPFEGSYAPRVVEDRGGGAYRLTVRPDGSVVLPEAVRSAFGLDGAGAVMARLEGDEFKLVSTATAWRRVDERMSPYKWKGGPMASDELIAERRAQSERD